MTIPNENHACIVDICQGGMKGVKIANKVGVCIRIVHRIVKQFKENRNFKSHASHGRPKLLDERDIQNIILFVRSNHRASLIEITNACPMLVSNMTIYRTVYENGIFS